MLILATERTVLSVSLCIGEGLKLVKDLYEFIKMEDDNKANLLKDGEIDCIGAGGNVAGSRRFNLN